MTKKDLKELRKWYEEELKRRDKMIDDLKEHNTVLMKASLNSSKKIVELTDRLKKIIKKD